MGYKSNQIRQVKSQINNQIIERLHNWIFEFAWQNYNTNADFPGQKGGIHSHSHLAWLNIPLVHPFDGISQLNWVDLSIVDDALVVGMLWMMKMVIWSKRRCNEIIFSSVAMCKARKMGRLQLRKIDSICIYKYTLSTDIKDIRRLLS